jgi:hypothetical protein
VDHQQAADGKPEAPMVPPSSRLAHSDPEEQGGKRNESYPSAVKPTIHLVRNAEVNRQGEKQCKSREGG